MEEELKSVILEAVKRKFADMGFDVEISMYPVEKDNGIVLNGIVVRDSDSETVPIIHIDQWLTEVDSGKMTQEDLAAEVVKAYKGAISSGSDFKSKIWNIISPEFILENVRYRLLNKEGNESRLEDLIYRPFLDLVAVCYCDLDDSYSIAISWPLIQKFGIREKKFLEAAEKNTLSKGYRFMGMTQALAESQGILIPNSLTGGDIMYVVKGGSDLENSYVGYGATAMLFPEYLRKIAEDLQSRHIIINPDPGFYILPSSIHELIIVRDFVHNPSELSEMVRDINKDVVEQIDFLSDSVYHWDPRFGEVRIVW